MNDDRSRQKISVEDLLRIKRAERPPAEFWANFERELRAKQLAAIVEKRPWWTSLSRAFAGVARLHVPLGAIAVLAVTFLTVREYRAPSADHDLSIPAVARVAPATAPADESADSTGAVSAPASVTTAAAEPASRPAIVTAEPVVSTVKPGEIGQVINGLSESDDTPRVANPSFRFINSTSLAAVQPVEPETVTAIVETAHGFESRGLPARMTEPLSQLPTPQTVSMRNRYLGTALPTGYSVETTASSPGRLINHIDGSKLHPDDFSRFETHGDSLSIKL